MWFRTRRKRSAIQEADGFAYLGGDITLNQAKAQALADAKRNAAEAALTYIQSNTKVENFEVRYDVIVSKAEAAVRCGRTKGPWYCGQYALPCVDQSRGVL